MWVYCFSFCMTNWFSEGHCLCYVKRERLKSSSLFMQGWTIFKYFWPIWLQDVQQTLNDILVRKVKHEACIKPSSHTTARDHQSMYAPPCYNPRKMKQGHCKLHATLHATLREVKCSTKLHYLVLFRCFHHLTDENTLHLTHDSYIVTFKSAVLYNSTIATAESGCHIVGAWAQPLLCCVYRHLQATTWFPLPHSVWNSQAHPQCPSFMGYGQTTASLLHYPLVTVS